MFCNIDASALAAVLFVLFVVMMIAQSSTHQGVSADLPHVSLAVSMPGALREDAMLVSVMRDGRIYFGSERLAVAGLHTKILDRLKDHSVERRVYIRADARARFRLMKDVLNEVASTGIQRVGFLAEQRRRQTSVP